MACLGAKIIAVADAFDAITTNRPYQKARRFDEGLAILIAITDLRQDRPVLSDITTDGPIGLGKDNVKKRTATSWPGSGATEAELMVFDSLTQDVIAAARDSRTIGLKEKFTKWGAAEDAFQLWADRLRMFLDQARDLTT